MSNHFCQKLLKNKRLSRSIESLSFDLSRYGLLCCIRIFIILLFNEIFWKLMNVTFSYKWLFHYLISIKFQYDIEFRGHSTTTWTEFCHFLTPSPFREQFLYPERGQKQTFFDPLPPHLVHVVIEWPLMSK